MAGEYGTYRATRRIYVGNALAFNIGDWVPVSHVDGGIVPLDAVELASGVTPPATDVFDERVADLIDGDTATRAQLEAAFDAEAAEVVPPLVAAAIAADDTVAVAAAAAVTQDIQGRDLVETHDPIVMRALDDPTYAWALTRNSRGALLVRHDGTVEAPRGVVTPSVRLVQQRFTMWGDSLTAGPAANSTVAYQSAAKLSMLANARGWAGQTAEQVAARQGGAPALLTFAGNTIPTSGGVTVTVPAATHPLTPLNGAASASLVGRVEGVPGTLSWDGTTLTFTRTTAGQAVTVSPATPFIPTLGSQYRGDVQVYWVGRNAPTRVTETVASVRSMIQYGHPRDDKFLVLQVIPGVGWENPAAVNTALAKEFAENFVRVADWLMSTAGAASVSYTLTADDLSDIAAGVTPRAYRYDGVHLNALGNSVVAALLVNEFTARGWN